MSQMQEEIGFSVFATKKATFRELAAEQDGFSPNEFCTEMQTKRKEPPVVRDVSESLATGVPQKVLFEENGAKQVELSTIPRLDPSDSQTTVAEVIVATDCKTVEDDVVLTKKDSSKCHGEQPGDIGNGKMVGQDDVFVKESPLWKEVVESMEVFQAIPQKPHFRPLLKVREAIREGVALGRMITFATLVQKASKLEIEDPVTCFTYILDSLPDLKRHGFDVASLKLRVEKLKSLKESQQQLLKQSASECEEHSQGLAEIQKDIEEIDTQMKSLEENKALLMSKKDKEESELAKAREEAEGANQGIERTSEEFAILAASPW